MPTNPRDMNEYRECDRDLIQELDSIIDTMVPGSLDDQARKINRLKIKATLRNAKASQNLQKTTDKYSVILIVLTIVLIVLTGILCLK